MNPVDPGSSVNHFMALYGFPAQVILALILQAFLWIVPAPLSELTKRKVAGLWITAVIIIPFFASLTGVAIAQLVT